MDDQTKAAESIEKSVSDIVEQSMKVRENNILMPSSKSIDLVARAREEIDSAKRDRIDVEAAAQAKISSIEEAFENRKAHILAMIDKHTNTVRDLTKTLEDEDSSAKAKVHMVSDKMAEEMAAADQQIAAHEAFIASMAKNVTPKKTKGEK